MHVEGSVESSRPKLSEGSCPEGRETGTFCIIKVQRTAIKERKQAVARAAEDEEAEKSCGFDEEVTFEK